jgi:two-component system CheB/CheR fusion protein
MEPTPGAPDPVADSMPGAEPSTHAPEDEGSSLHFPVVGVGASAGALAALTKLFEGLPATTGMAFVVVMHLSPRHESSAAEILQKTTRMPVRKVTEATDIAPDTVYVIPPNHGLSMVDGQVNLTPLERDHGRHVVIDLFFRTLARTHRERAVAVLLSGSGTDGSVGIGDIKQEGGVILAQSLEDAEFDGMPASAMATGLVDVVLPAAEMGQKLVELWRNARQIELPDAEGAGIPALPPTSPEVAEQALRRIMEILHARTGHDFKHYKRATVLRRIERRLQVNALPHLPAYEDFLQKHPQETTPLLSDMLIGVTNFFRDREAFESLERTVVPSLVADTPQDEQLRLWVGGCSSGEEAYSLLMLVHQEMAAARIDRPVQVFATDIDQAAIAKGREGRYPESVQTDIPPPLMRRYMSRDGNDLRVNKLLRSHVLFAQHNILRDPPFSRLDLISCRNLLIYLDRAVQQDILQMFHFALRPGGYLFLGSSETADAATRLFNVVDKKNRIYQANAMLRSTRALPRFPLGGVDHRPVAHAESGTKPAIGVEDLHRQLLLDFAPASVIVRPDGEILHSHRAEGYLRFVAGVPSQQLFAVILPELRPAARTAIFQAMHGEDIAQCPDIKISRDGLVYDVTVAARAVQHANWPGELLLLTFHERADRSDADERALNAAARDPILHQMEAELQRKDDQLQRVITQYETAVEDLKSSNEELQAINEELRSATEELETSKEELQSTNEELITVNNELKAKVEETAEINDDLQNLIASSEIATIFVDRDMRIKRFTPATGAVFNIIPADIGRSLLDITHRLDYPGLADDALATFSSLRPVEREVAGRNEHWYLARMLPYRTAEDRIDGAVLTFVDITSRRSAERRVDMDRERMLLIAASIPDFAILTLDEEGRVTSWSAGAEKVFGYSESEVLGQPSDLIFTPEDRAAGVPQKEMQTASTTGRALDERWHQRKDGSRVFVSGIMAPMRLGRLKGYAKIARDMTDRQQEEASRSLALTSAVSAADRAHQASQMKDEFLAVMSHELKNPLNLIQLNAQLLTALPEVQSLAAVLKIGHTIQQTVRSQARIIDDLLDLSRTRTGKLMLNVGPLYLAEALRDSLSWAAKQAAERKIGFSTDVTEEPLLVRADSVRIEQVALNLLSNAIKFTPAGGRITVRLDREGSDALLEVVDSGRGIPASSLADIFELFKQGEPQRSQEQGGGLGIGLALVRALVELHGGRVSATSGGPGRGACFRVLLPLTTRSVFGDLDEAAPVASLEGLRILYVEDSPDALEMFSALLQMAGAEVWPAGSGDAALKLIEEGRVPDLVISDVGMPGMDGYQLVQALRARPATADVPAIALTGYGRPKDVARATEAGFDGHLSKPVDLQRLRKLIGELQVQRQQPPGTA